jgi:hypothetical protein
MRLCAAIANVLLTGGVYDGFEALFRARSARLQRRRAFPRPSAGERPRLRLQPARRWSAVRGRTSSASRRGWNGRAEPQRYEPGCHSSAGGSRGCGGCRAAGQGGSSRPCGLQRARIFAGYLFVCSSRGRSRELKSARWTSTSCARSRGGTPARHPRRWREFCATRSTTSTPSSRSADALQLRPLLALLAIASTSANVARSAGRRRPRARTWAAGRSGCPAAARCSLTISTSARIGRPRRCRPDAVRLRHSAGRLSRARAACRRRGDRWWGIALGDACTGYHDL